MTIMSRAQNFEDVLLWRALRDVDKGSYIDVGAQDPVKDSVSHAFYEAGWRGLHVEATAFYANCLRNARPDEVVVEAAVADCGGLLPFYEIKATGISTGDADIAAHHREHGFVSRLVQVPTVRLEALFDLVPGEVHWLKVDVEGMEGDVLRSWGDHSKRPWVLVVESTYPNSQEPTEHLWIDEVLTRGYQETFFDGLSRYFVHESHHELIPALSVPANVFDGFAVPRDHFSAGALRVEIERLEARQSELRSETEARLAEVDQARSAAQSANAELDRVQALLASAEADFRGQIVSVWQEALGRQKATVREFQAREDHLQSSLRDAMGKETSARVEAARLEERVLQLRNENAALNDTVAAAREQLLRARDEAAQAQENARQVAERHATAQADAARLRQDLAALEREVVRLRNEAERHRALAESAHSFLERIRDEPPTRWQRFGLWLRLQQPSPLRKQLSHWSVPREQPEAALSFHHQFSPIEPELAVQQFDRDDRRNPYHRANTLGELLDWNDVDFVRCAYVTMLGRQPDLMGEAHYTRQVRAGVSKYDVLWQLRRSAEAKSHDPGIAGLDRALKRAAFQRRPLLGSVARLLDVNADADGRRDRALRAVMNMTAVNHAYLRALYHTQPAGPGEAGWTAEPIAQSSSSVAAVGADPAAMPESPETHPSPELEHLRNATPMAQFARANAL